MDAARFDAWTRRRFGIAAGSVIAVASGLATGDSVHAKKKKKLKFNQFGCVNVGGRCRGKDKTCCSGICRGNKPRKGKKDKSRCAAHDSGTCQPGPTAAICGGTMEPCTTSLGQPGTCATTTGNAGFCLKTTFSNQFCTRDPDCADLGDSGARGACLRCPSLGTPICASPFSILPGP